MRNLLLTSLLVWASAATAAPFEMQFVNVNGKPEGGLVVTLRSTDANRRLAKPVPALMDQIDLQFVPHVLVVPVGSPISFPNGDTVSHQVYSFSPAKHFELPLYRGRTNAPEQLFDREGIVTLGCNIHDQMRAYIYVVEAQYYGRADRDGRWSVPNVEPGEYRLTIWHPLSRTQSPVLEQRVTVGAEAVHLKPQATTALKLRNESQVPANWDAY